VKIDRTGQESIGGGKGDMNCSSRTPDIWRNLVVLALLSLAMLPAVGNPLHAEEEVQRLMVGVGHTEILDFAKPIKRISIANPDIADATVTSPRQLIVNGKEIGATTLIVWDEDDRYSYYKLVVHSENTYNQVMLRVRFAEIDRTAFREFGTDFLVKNINVDGDDVNVGSYGGDVVSPFLGTEEEPLVLSDNVDFFLAVPTRDFTSVIKALEEKRLLTMLARPNLSAISGAEASFLAGGEIPVPVVSGTSNQVTVEYKEYGIRLDFVPTVLDSELINVKVATEVSSLDFDNGIVLSGFRIPALISNKAETVVELRDGEMFVIGGMILNEVARGDSRIPVLGHLPIVGYLFGSHRYQNKESEILIMISPHIVRAMTEELDPEVRSEG
jgi:pilus assembly protein CpaC